MNDHLDTLAPAAIVSPDVSYRYGQTAMSTLDAELQTHLRSGAKRICDVGGGANPVATVADIEDLGLEYAVLDASCDELAKAPSEFDTAVLDIDDRVAVERLVDHRAPFDLVVTRWTAEHVPRGRHFHQQIRRLLRPGGTAIHLFPTLYSPVFVLNRLLPHSVSALVVPHVDGSGRQRGGPHEAFRPYYSWCRGPTQRQLVRLTTVGFAVRHYIGFFGHPYYARARPLHSVHEALSRWLLRHPVPSLTSYALVVLERVE